MDSLIGDAQSKQAHLRPAESQRMRNQMAVEGKNGAPLRQEGV